MAVMTIDPVCGMTVEDSPRASRVTHEGQTYVFCSTTCRDRFSTDPGRYARTGGEPGA